jgi:hypothetical protein
LECESPEILAKIKKKGFFCRIDKKKFKKKALQGILKLSDKQKYQESRMSLLKTVSDFWKAVQLEFFPRVEEEIGPLTSNHKKLISILEMIQIQRFVRDGSYRGRPAKDRGKMARAFIAKVVLQLRYTIQLIDYLKSDKQLRLICGWDTAKEIPSESKFSRVFEEFAQMELPQRVHELFIQSAYEDQLILHVTKDSVPVEVRESVAEKPNTPKAWKKKKRQRQGKALTPAPKTRIERQFSGEMSLDEMLQDLPKTCDHGTKTDAKGFKLTWKGYKLHAAIDDYCVPISVILTSASTHDSQVAIPLATKSDKLVDSCYDLMDSAYNIKEILEHSRSLGHVPLAAPWPKNTAAKEEIKEEEKRRRIIGWKPAEAIRYCQRSKAERFNALFKDYYSGNNIRVRGYKKVACHVMFGVLTLACVLLMNLIQ